MPKSCFRCRKIKSLDEFYTHPGMGDGHLNKCKECTRADAKANRANKWHYYHLYERTREKSQKRRELKYQYEVRGRFANPIKYKARTTVNNAIRDGRLKRNICYNCGSADSQAHHDDYNKPLQIRWLCFDCHRAEHGQITVNRRKNLASNYRDAS